MKTQSNFQDADAFYECLLDAHHGLTREQSEALNARLILVLANQLGNTALLQGCIEAAKTADPSEEASGPTGKHRAGQPLNTPPLKMHPLNTPVNKPVE